MKYILSTFFLWILLFSCKQSIDPESNDYFSQSFETITDTIGWHGTGSINICAESPQNGSGHSLNVSGGCLYPHAYKRLRPLNFDHRFILKCLAKTRSSGGGIKLASFGLPSYLSLIHTVHVRDTVWTVYQTEDTLNIPAGYSPEIRMSAGGIVSSDMQIEWIKIISVN